MQVCQESFSPLCAVNPLSIYVPLYVGKKYGIMQFSLGQNAYCEV